MFEFACPPPPPHDFEAFIQSVCYKKEKVQRSRLAKFESRDRLLLCYAAKNSFRQFNPQGPVPALREDHVEQAQIYEIGFTNGGEKHAAIKCPTSPRIYVHFKNLRVNSDMQVLYVANEGKSDENHVKFSTKE